MKKLFISLYTGVLLVVILQIAALRSLAEEDCAVDRAWLNTTSPPDLTMTPKSHGEGGDDCPFYQAAWRTFLYATKPNGGSPAFVSDFKTIESTFSNHAKIKFPPQKINMVSLLPRVIQEPGHSPVNAGLVQAGDTAGVLIDRDGYPIYYGIHMNDVFTSFIVNNKLTTPAGATSASSNLAFPTGAIELKSAWKIVPPGSSLEAKYFVVDGQVPRMKKLGGLNPDVIIDTNTPPIDVKVALVALHVVFVLGNHSEFIWSTFEHTDEDGNPDTAPSGPIPGTMSQTNEVSTNDFLLFRAHTTVGGGNLVSTGRQRAAQFDEAAQRFTGTTETIPSSIYRFYPYSKINGRDDTTHKIKKADQLDDQVVAINKHMGDLFKEETAAGVADKRRFYRLVGAVWLDKHDSFQVNKPFRNGSNQTSDEGDVAGEDALSSTAMESFTQDDKQNCFSCHDTQAITRPNSTKIVLDPKLINVSHILSKYLLEKQ